MQRKLFYFSIGIFIILMVITTRVHALSIPQKVDRWFITMKSEAPLIFRGFIVRLSNTGHFEVSMRKSYKDKFKVIYRGVLSDQQTGEIFQVLRKDILEFEIPSKNIGNFDGTNLDIELWANHRKIMIGYVALTPECPRGKSYWLILKYVNEKMPEKHRFY